VTGNSTQNLRFLPGRYMVDTRADVDGVPDDVDWLALVRAPEGLTVIRRVGDQAGDAWTALYSGDTAHALDVPGMLVALLEPLRQAAVPVFVASTFHADVVLVPEARREDAVRALRAAGHEVDTGGSGASLA
jgi:hypothetical protein